MIATLSALSESHSFHANILFIVTEKLPIMTSSVTWRDSCIANEGDGSEQGGADND